MTKEIKTIIFDMDGIIFDTENMFLSCCRKVAEDYNLTGADEVYRRVLGLSAEATKAAYMEFYGEDFDYDKLNGLALDIFHEIEDTEGIPVKLGAVELLEYLSQNNYQIGLASSTPTHVVRKQLGNADLLKYFKVTIGGDMVEKSKPAPDIFLKALAEIEASQQTSILPENVYAIEDSFNGVRSAHAAGMRVIMVPDMVKDDGEMQDLAYKILPNLLKVKDFLQNS